MSRRFRLIAPVALVGALLAAAPLARGGDPAANGPSTEDTHRNDAIHFIERWRKEAAIERRMIGAEVKGVLGLYEKPEAPDWTPRRAGKGSLEVVRGIPVLRLEGTPEEMGEQAGTLVGREARALSKSYLPAFVGGKRALAKARVRAHALFDSYLNDDEKHEMHAFARASGLSEEDVFLAQGFVDMYRLWSCTTIGAVGAASDEPLLGRNLDFVDMGFLHRYACVVVARPEGKRAYVSVSWPGLIGVLSGMNDAGVALAVMVVHDEHTCSAGVPFQLAFRRALETAQSTADVDATLRATKLTVTNNLMVVDAEGAARVLELAPSGVVAREPDARGRIAATNHFLSRERRESRITFTYLSSRRRLAAAEKVCEAAEKITVPVAIEGLRASAAGPINVQSMVFLPRSGELWLALGTPPAADHAFVRLERAELLGR